jgi:succinate-acetate transporter protein
MSPPSISSTDEYVEDEAATDLSRAPTQAGQPGNLHPHSQRLLMSKRNIANPSPLGLCGFAFTTFLLSAINLGVLGVTHPNIIVAGAFAYGGLVQLLAGMWLVLFQLFSFSFLFFWDLLEMGRGQGRK